MFNCFLIIAIIFVFIIVSLNFKSIKMFLKKSDTRNIQINTKERYVQIENTRYRFSDINSISVLEDEEQPSTCERYFTRYSHKHYFAEFSFILNNGDCIKYKVVSKAQIYKILKTMQPYVKLNDKPEYFKTPFCDGPTLFGVICIILYFMYKFLH